MQNADMKVRKEGGGEDFPGAGAEFTLHFGEETPGVPPEPGEDPGKS